MNRPTRFYSSRQEKAVAKAVGGKQTSNSGATDFIKGDVLTDKFLLECKTVTDVRKSFTIQRSWIEKNREEAFAMGKPYSALVFNFEPNGENHYVIDEKMFKRLITLLKEEENGNQHL